MTRGRFEVFRDRAGEYRWRLKAGNGEVVAASEGYTRRGDAHDGCAAVLAAVGAPGVLTASAPAWAHIQIVDVEENE